VLHVAKHQELFERGVAELAYAQTAAALFPFSQDVLAPYRNATLTFTGSLRYGAYPGVNARKATADEAISEIAALHFRSARNDIQYTRE